MENRSIHVVLAKVCLGKVADYQYLVIVDISSALYDNRFLVSTKEKHLASEIFSQSNFIETNVPRTSHD